MEKNKSKNLTACIICGILTVFAIAVSIVSMFKEGNDIRMIDAVNLIVCALIGYYAFVGYRKPHGNLLKYIILLATVTRFVGIYLLVELGGPWMAVIRAMIPGLSFYVAGRLHKVKQNIILLSIITGLILAGTVIAFIKGVTAVGAVTSLIIWVDIFVAYVLRYKAHREAGLTDAPKAN